MVNEFQSRKLKETLKVGSKAYTIFRLSKLAKLGLGDPKSFARAPGTPSRSIANHKNLIELSGPSLRLKRITIPER